MSEAEVDALYPVDGKDTLPPALAAEMRTTYRAIASHNKFGRENCKDWPKS